MRVLGATPVKQQKGHSLWHQIYKHKVKYMLLLPAIVFMAVTLYYPMFSGVVMSLQDFNMGNNPTFVGLKNYKELLGDVYFWQAVVNTLIVGGGSLFACYFSQLTLAILLNELRSPLYRRITQTVAYLPNLFSWVAIAGIWIAILAPDTGFINVVLKSLGHDSIPFISSGKYIRQLLVLLSVWKTTGYGCIIFLAAIISVDHSIYEAATIDGANRFHQIIHIMLPSISGTMKALFLLNMIEVLKLFDQPYVMGNPAVIDKVQTIMTYTYSVGIMHFRFDYASAVSVVVIILTAFLLLIRSLLMRGKEENKYVGI